MAKKEYKLSLTKIELEKIIKEAIKRDRRKRENKSINEKREFLCPKCKEIMLLNKKDFLEYKQDGAVIVICPYCDRKVKIIDKDYYIKAKNAQNKSILTGLATFATVYGAGGGFSKD